jgi:hypothetical protein
MSRIIAIYLLVGAAAGTVGAAERGDRIDFNRDIRPILSNACFKCHGPDANERQGGLDGLRFDTEEGVFADLGGYAAIVRGRPEESEFVRRITTSDEYEIMPPLDSGKKLSGDEIEVLKRWIQQGAPYAKHWSYVKPVRPSLPAVSDASWIRNEIDYFIQNRLEQEGLAPAAEADRYALIRRLSLDLTGLPPTIEEVDRFVADTSSEAYEKLVDRLLASSAYGEHWARMWLDLARYADSAGYADDPPRTIWAYRDWVITSLNANKPFDRFTIEQIAGDLLPEPTEEQLVATAFHRNTMTNNEGGTNDEEFRNVAVVDRVNTTLAVWMGTTMACAQCHNHKYDPISQEEFFRFFAFLNSTEDADRRDESPLLSIFSDEQKRQKAEWEAEIAELEEKLRTPTPERSAAQARWEERLASLKKQRADMKPSTTVPVLRELAADKRRKTFVQYRGNFLDLGPQVTAGVPEALFPLPEGAPRDRLTLAKWLVDPDNPLTSRVIANRYWEKIFGIGIVRTSEEFGAQGDLPSHPELLDWLATELVDHGWDTKHLVKLMVMSAAYRQSSRVTPELWEKDPDNRLLGRGPRFRLSAEMIRDQALLVSGLLSRKMYGPSVRPPQPSLGLSAAFGSGIDWQTSQGEDRYRRGIYTTWRRSNPYPSMVTFDAPNREVCTLRRDRTNTPLQAFVTLNDPVFVEAAQALARRMGETGGTAADKARYGFRRCLARHPSERELNRLVQLYGEAYKRISAAPDQARRMAANPLGPLPEGADPADLAAWTVVGNVLLNLDEMVMKR